METFIIPEFTKTEPNTYLLRIVLKKISTNTASHGAQFDIALKNRALSAQTTD